MSIKGFMLLLSSSIVGYRGVDRYPFEPMLVDTEIDTLVNISEEETRIWVFYPPSWRQDAYRLYEENLAQECQDDFFMLSNSKAAQEIKKLIEPHVGLHEIVECEVWSFDSLSTLGDVQKTNSFLGYDIAYLRGDYYSAILNGLLVNSHPDLVNEFGSVLNENLLFETQQVIPKYINRFVDLVPSEESSSFWLYQLSHI